MRRLSVPRVVEKTADRLAHQRQLVRAAFQPSADSVYLLSAEEQLERFLNMTPEDLMELQQRWGDAEVQEYIQSQIKCWLRKQYG